MEGITKLLESLNLEKLVPDLSVLQVHMRILAGWLVILGPVILMILGLMYLVMPPKEANRKFGHRTYFGMGSPQAWQFTQRLAGIVYISLGTVLLIAMVVVKGGFAAKPLDVMMSTAAKCLLWQIGLILAAYIGIGTASAMRFDSDGQRR